MLHRYVTLAEWHWRRGQRLDPPSWRPPRVRFAALHLGTEDPDPEFTAWIERVADYLERLDAETKRQQQRLPHPQRQLQAIARAVPRFWFQRDKLARLVAVREQTADQLDDIVNVLATNLAISNEYVDVVLQHADRAQSPAAQQALESILTVTHADEATL